MSTYKNTARRLERLERASVTPTKVGAALHIVLEGGGPPAEPELARQVQGMAGTFEAMLAVERGDFPDGDEKNSLSGANPVSGNEYN